MKKKLEMLEQLQEIDLLLDILKSSLEGLQLEMNEIDSECVTAREALEEMVEREKQIEQDKIVLETNHAAELENIKRSETNMKEIKTNKEYQAVGREIAAARKQAAEIEEQVLQKLTQIDELKAEIDTKTTDLETLEQNAGKRRTAKQAEIDKVQKGLNNDISRRETISKEMAASLLKRYNNLRAQRRGQAIAIASDGSCQGCNMNLPPQLYNSLFRGDDLHTCPHCQRILILKQAQ